MPKKILILAANPRNTSRLRLDEEVRDIEDGLQRARRRDEFVLKQQWAIRPQDIRRAMLDFSPNIVHFSGHGEGEAGLAFENKTGDVQFVDAEALAGLFELFADTVECVLLNACYSEIQADAIAQYIPYVIGMKQAIGDRAALEFAVAFYDALGAGKSTEFAYKLACNAIQMADIPSWEGQGVGAPEHLTPVMIAKSAEGKASEAEELLIPGKRYAFLVGPQYVPEEQNLEPLKNTGRDAEAFRRLLKHENIGGFHEAVILKGKVPGYQIAKEIQKLFAQTDRGDLMLLYFSGHVGIDAEYGWYFLDSETSADMFSMSPLSLENIKRQFIMRSQVDRIVIILDCLYHTENENQFTEEALRKAFDVFSDISEDKQIVIISSLATTVEEKEGSAYGLLTRYLTEGLETGRADFNKTGRTTLGELHRYVCYAPHFSENKGKCLEPFKWELHTKGDIVLASTTDKPLAKGKYKHIADLLKKGEVIPFLGVDAFIQPSIKKELSKKMAGLTGLNEKTSPLTLLSQYYETKTSRYDLCSAVKEIILEHLKLQPTQAHHFLAAVEKPLIILTTMYDPLLEKVFQERNKKYILITHLTNPDNEGDRGKVAIKYFHGKEEGETDAEILSPERLLIKDPDTYSIIYKLQGCFNLRWHDVEEEEVDSLIISEQDYLSFLEWFTLPEPLNRPLKTRMLLFLGSSIQDWNDRVLIHAILRDRNQLRRQPYAVGKAVDPFEESYWKSKNVELIEEELSDFILELTEDMEIGIEH